jgi:hypothetical protein
MDRDLLGISCVNRRPDSLGWGHRLNFESPYILFAGFRLPSRRPVAS